MNRYGVAPTIAEVISNPIIKAPLHHAAATCNIPKLKQLLKYKDIEEKTCFNENDIENDNCEENDEMVNHNNDEEETIYVDGILSDGSTALTAATLTGCAEGIHILVRRVDLYIYGQSEKERLYVYVYIYPVYSIMKKIKK